MKILLVGIILANLINNTITLADVNNTQQTQENVSTVANLPSSEVGLSEAQLAWIQKLRMCESSGNDDAINPRDLDLTPSYGRYQFKPSTFEYFSNKYKLGYQADEYMQGDKQEEIVKRMINDPSVKIQNQFPLCVKVKIGYPPK